MVYPGQCKCGGNNNLRFRARCKDMLEIELDGHIIHDGYAVGSEFGMNDDSGGDYLIFTFCASCGQILNGNFPISKDLCIPYITQKE